MEKRKAKRDQIQVDIEIAQPGANRCYGYAENISRTGVSVVLREGGLPPRQRLVILNFKIRTGGHTLYRKINARMVRQEQGNIGLEFTRQGFTADSIIQDLIYYQRINGKIPQLKQSRYGLLQDRITG